MGSFTDDNGQIAEFPPAKRTQARLWITALLAAFIGGAILAGWAIQRFDIFTGEEPVKIIADDPGKGEGSNDAPGAMPVTSRSLDRAESRINQLEDRLSQITAKAQAATGNASRAESILVALATRRAVDAGKPLGPIADQLSVRFGTDHPQSVRTIIEGAAQPVTLAMLQTDLDALAGPLTINKTDNLWENIKREMGELFTLRKEGATPPDPIKHMQQAIRFANNGNIAAAMDEVRAMPGAANAEGWLTRARRYLRTQRAVENIERAAMLTPVPLTILAGDNDGGQDDDKNAIGKAGKGAENRK